MKNVNEYIMDIKTLVLELPPPPKSKGKGTTNGKGTTKEKSRKIITESEHWSTISQHLDLESQKHVLREIRDLNTQGNPLVKTLLSAFRTKIAGYKAQDMAKHKYDVEKFVNVEDVILSLERSELLCYYCRKSVLLFYEYVREPRQWSLERIDNKWGHNRDNVEIACLECNLRRKTMYHERYMYTKQVTITKHDNT
jgi:hypothetical protein